MRVHKEGFVTILVVFISLAIANFLFNTYLPQWLFWLLLIVSLVFWGFIISFFRNPPRAIDELNSEMVFAPADGKIVVIEETNEVEYFKDKRIQVSIFMSPLNVHVNRNPISGIVKYYKYHPGKYLVAWHPKSSEENERNTVVIGNGNQQILLRQIAGAVARRIVNYLKEGQEVIQGKDLGFIKFGSRVDLFLPLDAKINVKIDQKVLGNKTVIATLN